ncbi:hypothetical protein Ciccas_004993 [Cichlidogyrus casuarinus]|uniref:BED-type domain-containing protein n=1 Tax=Cichlidogyrus casuarinus TaxID=1844966 RepID=A0ABD2QAT8_9PLAT
MDVLNINSQTGHQQLANTLSAFLQNRHQMTQNCGVEHSGLSNKLMEVSTGSSTSDEPTDLSPTNTNPAGTPTRAHFPGNEDMLSDSDNFNRKTPNSDLDPSMPNLLSPNHYNESPSNMTTPQSRMSIQAPPRRKNTNSGAKSGTKKSFVWKYFCHPHTDEGMLDRSRTQCRLCDSLLAFNASGTTTTMLNHLKSRHGDVAESEEMNRRYHRELNLGPGISPPSSKKLGVPTENGDGPQVKRRKQFNKDMGTKPQNGLDDSIFSQISSAGNFPAAAQQRAMLAEILANNRPSFHAFQKPDLLSHLAGQDDASDLHPPTSLAALNPFQNSGAGFSNPFGINLSASQASEALSPLSFMGLGSPKQSEKSENKRESRSNSPQTNYQQLLTNFLANMQQKQGPGSPQNMFNAGNLLLPPNPLVNLLNHEKGPANGLKADQLGPSGFPSGNLLNQNVLSTLTNLLNVHNRDTSFQPQTPLKLKEESREGTFPAANPGLLAQLQACLAAGKLPSCMSPPLMNMSQTKSVSRRKRQPKQLIPAPDSSLQVRMRKKVNKTWLLNIYHFYWEFLIRANERYLLYAQR